MAGPSLGLTSYAEQLAAFAGMLYDLSDGQVIKTARSSEASAEIPFGACVIRDTDALSPASPVANVKLPAAGGFRAYGLVLHTHDYENGPNGTLGTTGLKPDATLNILRRGMMYGTVEDAATEGNAAFVRHTVNGGNNPGNLRSDADTAKAEEVTGIIFRTTRTDAGIVILEVDMPTYDGQKNV